MPWIELHKVDHDYRRFHFQTHQANTIKKVIFWIKDGLLWIPWPVLIVAVTLLAWRVAGPMVGVFSAVALLLIGLSGLWPSAMETMALMVTAVTISVAIGDTNRES